MWCCMSDFEFLPCVYKSKLGFLAIARKLSGKNFFKGGISVVYVVKI